MSIPLPFSRGPVHNAPARPLRVHRKYACQNTYYPHYQTLTFSGHFIYHEGMLNVRERRREQKWAQVIELIDLYGIDNTATALNVYRTTVVRWREKQTEPPEAVRIALNAIVMMRLPGMECRTWEGWGFDSDGNLCSPAGEPFHTGDLLALPYLHGQIRALKKENAELRKRLEIQLKAAEYASNDHEFAKR